MMDIQLRAIVFEARALHESVDSATFQERLNAFLGQFLPKQRVPIESLRPVFARRYNFDSRDLADLQTDAVPLALVRELITRNGLVIKKDRFPNWERFVDLYREAIYA